MAGLRPLQGQEKLVVGGDARAGRRKVTVLDTRTIFPAVCVGWTTRWVSCLTYLVRFRDGQEKVFVSDQDRKMLTKCKREVRV